MRFAIIAAGEGSRLAAEGLEIPKPLVRIAGEELILRLCRVFHAAKADEIAVIVNQLHPESERFVRTLMEQHPEYRIRLVVKTTPGSMISFSHLAPLLKDAPFCLTTVDTVFRETDFFKYIGAFQADTSQALMAVTDFIDDERPLYVGTDVQMNVTGFFDEPVSCKYISGGIYCLHPSMLSSLETCLREKRLRMREFQRQLIADGFRVKAFPFEKILDIDHVSDIQKAESFLRSE